MTMTTITELSSQAANDFHQWIQTRHRRRARWRAAGFQRAVLRRGLYDCHVNEWRAAIKAGTLGNVTKKKSSRTNRTAEQQRIVALAKQVAKWEADLAR